MKESRKTEDFTSRMRGVSMTKRKQPLESLKDYVKDKDIDIEKALDKIIYGFEVILVLKDVMEPAVFFIDEKNNRTIKFLKKKEKELKKLDFDKISQIEFGAIRGGFGNLSKTTRSRLNTDLCLSIFSNSGSVDLVFENSDEIKLFCFSISFIWENEDIEEQLLGPKFMNIKQIWNKYDDDHSGKLERKEFHELAKEIRLLGTQEDLDRIFDKIDSDKSGKIDFQEFCVYFEELSSSKEFEKEFKKYVGGKSYLDPFDLERFLKEVQKEIVQLSDAVNIIIEFNKKIERNQYHILKEKFEKNKENMEIEYSTLFNSEEKALLKLDLENFQNFMVHSSNNALLFQEYSMDYPLYDYFIYSSHNTYLKGHQLYGESSVEMYAYAIMMGCRCVELDCWDGPNNEPKITHGMTFTSDILFKDVLINIKENAFKTTTTPFFLSIEMHCGDEQQKKMAFYFKKILKNCWTPESEGSPIYFPPPKSLNNTFIIKCKKPRVFRISEPDRKLKYVIKSDNSNENENGYLKYKSSVGFKRGLSEIKEVNEEFDPTHRHNDTKKTFREDNRSSLKNTIKNEDIQLKFDKKNEPDEQKLKDEYKKNRKVIKEVVPELYDLIGLISVGFEVDNLKEKKYQPWEVVSLSESKIMHFMETKKSELLDFTSGSFLRVYPKGSRVDSSNYDPIKSWLIGGQLVSLNLQSLKDDFTLINHIFFKNNNENGYILKPEFLRMGSLVIKEYKKKCFDLEFEILSGIMIQKCLTEHSLEVIIEAKVFGTSQDDKNPVLTTQKVTQNFLHPLFEGKTKFSIYEPELSFILVKIFDEYSNVLARSVIPIMNLMEGYRNIKLYDEGCAEIGSSLLVIRSNKIYD